MMWTRFCPCNGLALLEFHYIMTYHQALGPLWSCYFRVHDTRTVYSCAIQITTLTFYPCHLEDISHWRGEFSHAQHMILNTSTPFGRLPYINGMYSACVPTLIYALFGQSRQLAVGPVAMVSLLVEAGLNGQLGPECTVDDKPQYEVPQGMWDTHIGPHGPGWRIAKSLQESPSFWRNSFVGC